VTCLAIGKPPYVDKEFFGLGGIIGKSYDYAKSKVVHDKTRQLANKNATTGQGSRGRVCASAS
jgi:hypothetical protein